MSTNASRGTPGERPIYDCLVISDLHLGSDVCQAKLLEEFLEWAVATRASWSSTATSSTT